MAGMWSLMAGTHGCQLTHADGALWWQLVGETAGLQNTASRLAQVWIAGQELGWASAEQVEVATTANGVQTLVIAAHSQDGRFLLRQQVEVYPDHPFVRFVATLTNQSPEPATVTGCAILNLAISHTPLYLFHVDQFSWAYRQDFFSEHQAQIWPDRIPLEIHMGSYPSHHNGPSSCAWFALRPPPHDRPGEQMPHAGPGLVSGIEFNGKSRLHAWADSGASYLTSTIDALNHRLDPGAQFAIPACFVGRYHGDWDEAGYVTQRYAESYVHPPYPDQRYPWVQYNSWKYGQEIDEAQQLAIIDRCAELGIELVVMDLGWARTIGDWRPNPEKFPRGLVPLAERAHSYGMRFGVHIALAQCSIDAPVAQEHPEWLAGSCDDYFGAGYLCLGHEPCRNWLAGEILQLIDQQQLDYIIQDGEDMVKYCQRSDHSHAPGDSNYSGSQYGLDLLIGALRRERPGLVLENCEDGGCMMTYQMARLYHTSITVDNITSYATRQGIYGASYPFSPRYSVRYMEDDPTHYTLMSSIFGGPLILMQRIGEWNAQQIAETRVAIALYKRLRLIIRDAKIIHLQRPQANIPGGGWGWDAIQAVSADQQRSIVMVYRAQGDQPARRFFPRGLHSDMLYTLLIDSQHSQCTGATLMDEGLLVTLPEFGATLIELAAAP